MDLTLRAIRYMIWLNLVIAVVVFGLKVPSDQNGALMSVSLSLLTILILMAFRAGLRGEKAWVAVLFVFVCLFDLTNAITDGLSLRNLLNLADGVLSFVAICGIWIWFRERAITKAQQKA